MRIERYNKNLGLRKKGEYPGLPIFKIYPKLGKYIPSLPRETMLLFFGSTGSGKTQWHKKFCLNLALAHYTKQITNKPLFIINLLEESIDEYEDSMISMLYYEYYKKEINSNKSSKIGRLKLNSYTEELLTDIEFKRIKEVISPMVDELLYKYYRLQDNIYNAFGLYKHARDISKEIGNHYYIKLNNVKNSVISYTQYELLNKTQQEEYKWYKYELHDDNVYPIVITDHISRIAPEYDKLSQRIKTLHETLSDWSFNYCRKNISKNWKWGVLNIAQQTVYSETATYSNRNELNWEALKPNLGDLDTNKLISQDHHIVLGGFNPHRYANNGIIDGYDLERFKGKLRTIKILKNRIGVDQIELPWFFDGEVGEWKELTKSNLEYFYKLANL